MLTAGLGTRLQPLSNVRAKPAVPVAGRPLVGRILEWLGTGDVRDVVLNLHHLPETITSRVGDGSAFGARVRYSWERAILGSAGGPRKALSLLPNDDFFIVNGDTITDVDLAALEVAHRESGALVTLAVMKNKWPERYGSVITDSEGIFYGTVPRGHGARGYHFVGVQMVHPSVFADLPIDQPMESVSGVYKTLTAERRGSVRAFLCDPQFLDVGTPADYLAAALAAEQMERAPGSNIGAHARIDPSARLSDCIVWDDVTIGAGAVLERCVVADGVTIAAGAAFRDSAIARDHQNNQLIVTDIAHG